LLGHLAALTHLPLIVVFHLARVPGAFALMAGAWLFITHFIQDRSARRFALFFLAFGLGLGLIVWAAGRPVVFGNATEGLDLRMPELSAFYSILALPHFAWSGVFAAAGVALTLKAIERGSLRLGLLAGLAWLGQASIHPQMPVLIAGAVGCALLFRPTRPRGWVAAALAFAIPAPYILYSYLAFVGNPEVERWTFHSKNAVAPETFSLLFALAPQLLLAPAGVPGALRRATRAGLFLHARRRALRPGLQRRHRLCRALRRDVRLRRQDPDRAQCADGASGHRAVHPRPPDPVRDMDHRTGVPAAVRPRSAGLRHPGLQDL